MKERLIGTLGVLIGAALPFIFFMIYNTYIDVSQKGTPIGFLLLFSFPVTAVLCPIILLNIYKAIEVKKKKAELESKQAELIKLTKEKETT